MNANTPLHLLARATALPKLTRLTLDLEPIGRAATVIAVSDSAHAPEWASWLADLGFIPGERVMVTARAMPGGDPMAVRIGGSTFALRRAEAACVQVLPDEDPS